MILSIIHLLTVRHFPEVATDVGSEPLESKFLKGFTKNIRLINVSILTVDKTSQMKIFKTPNGQPDKITVYNLKVTTMIAKQLKSSQ